MVTRTSFGRGPANPKWKGGVSVNGCGYLRFSAGPNRGKYVHRVKADRQLVESLGRHLSVDEEVHHNCNNRACYPIPDFHLVIMDARLHAGSSTGHSKYRKK